MKLAFGRSRNESEMWVSLIEKAWSKLIGGYATTENGPCTLVYPHLCNKPSYDIKHNRDIANHDVLFRKIKRALDAGYPITCNTKKKLEGDHGVM